MRIPPASVTADTTDTLIEIIRGTYRKRILTDVGAYGSVS